MGGTNVFSILEWTSWMRRIVHYTMSVLWSGECEREMDIMTCSCTRILWMYFNLQSERKRNRSLVFFGSPTLDYACVLGNARERLERNAIPIRNLCGLCDQMQHHGSSCIRFVQLIVIFEWRGASTLWFSYLLRFHVFFDSFKPSSQDRATRACWKCMVFSYS